MFAGTAAPVMAKRLFFVFEVEMNHFHIKTDNWLISLSQFKNGENERMWRRKR
jgi:hypothetical protein